MNPQFDGKTQKVPMCRPMWRAISGGPDLSPVLVKVMHEYYEDREPVALRAWVPAEKSLGSQTQ